MTYYLIRALQSLSLVMTPFDLTLSTSAPSMTQSESSLGSTLTLVGHWNWYSETDSCQEQPPGGVQSSEVMEIVEMIPLSRSIFLKDLPSAMMRSPAKLKAKS